MDGGTRMTCWYETGRISGDCDRFAHNPEVAGSNPVPATKEGALTRPNGRRHQLAAGSFCERCEQRRSASVILTPSTTAMDAAIAGFAFPRVRTALLFGDLNGVPVAGLRADQKGPPRDGTFGYRRPGAQRVSRAENPLWKLPVDAPTSVGVVRRAIAPVLALGSRGYRWRR